MRTSHIGHAQFEWKRCCAEEVFHTFKIALYYILSSMCFNGSLPPSNVQWAPFYVECQISG